MRKDCDKVRTRTWGEALVVVWENFTGVRGDGEARSGRLSVCALLLLGSLWALRGFLQLGTPGRDVAPVERPAPAEEGRLRQAVHRARSLSASRAGALALARAMRTGGRNNPLVGAEPQAPQPSPAPTNAPAGDRTPPAVAPESAVRAVMILGGDRVAALDIGEEKGRIVRPGDRFLYEGAEGRVLRVGTDGLVLRWRGRDWSVPLED